MMLQVLGFLVLLLLRFLLGILLLVLFLVALILIVPFRYHGSGYRNEENAQVHGSFDWLFGAISLEMAYSQGDGFHMKMMLFSRWVLNFSGEDKEAVPDKKSKSGKKQQRSDFTFTLEKGLLLGRTGLRIVKIILPRRFHLDCRVGFEDPADTGTLCAGIAPFQAIFNKHSERYSVRIMPVFDEEELTGHFDIQGHIILWFIVWEGLKLAISRPFRQDIFTFMKPRKTFAQGGIDHV